jgi:hypothetical protein
VTSSLLRFASFLLTQKWRDLSMSAKQYNFIFRFQPLASSADGILLNYLKSFEPLADGPVLSALRAFWLPMAYQESGTKKKAELKKMAMAAVMQLEGQICNLCVMFDIQRPGYQQTSFVQPMVAPTPPMSVPKEQQPPIAQSNLEPDDQEDLDDDPKLKAWDSVEVIEMGDI